MDEKAKLIDTIGQFTVIPNSVIKLWPEIGSNAICMFLYLRYRSNKDGESFPSYDTICKDTGFGRERVASALDDLEKVGLLERNRRFSNSTIYVLKNPSISSENRLMNDEPLVVKTDCIGSENRLMNDDPLVGKADCISSENRLMNDDPLVGKADCSSSENRLPLVGKTDANQINLTRLIKPDPVNGDVPSPSAPTQKKGDIVDGMLAYTRRRPAIDVGSFPEDVRDVIQEFCSVWSLIPPKKDGKKGGEFALWISDARSLRDACGEMGLALIRTIHNDWNKGGRAYMVSRPGAIIKAARALAGVQRSTPVVPMELSPEEIEQRRTKFQSAPSVAT